MAIDTDKEELMSLTEAARILPRINGRKPAVSTLWRWCRKGLRGVKLDYLRYGHNIVTTRQAFSRFFASLAEVDAEISASPTKRPSCLGRPAITSKARMKSLQDADSILERAGI